MQTGCLRQNLHVSVCTVVTLWTFAQRSCRSLWSCLVSEGVCVAVYVCVCICVVVCRSLRLLICLMVLWGREEAACRRRSQMLAVAVKQ